MGVLFFGFCCSLSLGLSGCVLPGTNSSMSLVGVASRDWELILRSGDARKD